MEILTKSLSGAVLRILKPVVHVLLRYNVSHSEFVELAKRAYVDVASQDFTIPNRKKTASRVSVITGLSRKEVVRISAIPPDQEPETKGPLNRATRVIGGWLKDPEFLDSENEPMVLPLRNAVPSFEDLVNRYSGGITARAVLDELMRVGIVEKEGKEQVRLVKHGYVPKDSDAEMIDVLAKHTADLLSTGVHNLTHEKHEARFQRQVCYTEIPESVVKEFQQISHDKALKVLIELNQWLSEKKATVKSQPDEPTARVGMGLYYFKNGSGGTKDE